MARSYTGGDADQQSFVKVFDSLTGKYNRWEVWRDFVWMLACAISNSVDNEQREKRETIYMDIAKKYTPDEMDKFASLTAILIASMDEKAQSGVWGDFLGELFMNLNLGNELGGQFFTPYHVCLMMARTAVNVETVKREIEEHGYMSVNDPACGAGATLIAAAEVLKEAGVNYQEQVIFTGQDIDSTTALMCYIQLSLLGCAGYVVIGSTLSDPATGNVLFGEDSDRCWRMPMFYSDIWHGRRQAHKMRRLMQQMEADRKEEAPDVYGGTEQLAFDLGV